MENSVKVLKSFSTFVVASFAFIAIPFTDPSVEATETESQFNSVFSNLQNSDREIEMTPEDAEYIQKIREHYDYD